MIGIGAFILVNGIMTVWVKQLIKNIIF